MEQIVDLIRIMLKGWWIIAITTVTAVALSLLVSYTTEPVYRSSARYIVSPDIGLSDQTDLLRSLDTLDRTSIINTYAQVFGSRRIYQESLAEMGLDGQDVAGYDVSAVSLPESNVIQVSVEGTDVEQVRTLVETIGERSIDYVQDLYFLYNITLLDPASVPSSPISPTPTRDAGVAAVLGFILGVGLTFVYASYRQTQTSDDQSAPAEVDNVSAKPTSEF